MSWCDKLASTPSVGFRLTPHFAPSSAVLQNFSTLLEKMGTIDRPGFQVDRLEAFNFSLTTENGFEYGVETSKIYVKFTHSIRAKPVSGGPPVLEMLSKARPFTELLAECSQRVVEATLMLPKSPSRTFFRIGIVSTTVVSDTDLPPGIIRFIQYLRRPWKGLLENYQFVLTSEIEKTDGWRDICIHQLKKEDDAEGLISINLDWQRSFSKGRQITSDFLESSLRQAEKSALSYFEDLAEGSRFDEILISGSA